MINLALLACASEVVPEQEDTAGICSYFDYGIDPAEWEHSPTPDTEAEAIALCLDESAGLVAHPELVERIRADRVALESHLPTESHAPRLSGMHRSTQSTFYAWNGGETTVAVEEALALPSVVCANGWFGGTATAGWGGLAEFEHSAVFDTDALVRQYTALLGHLFERFEVEPASGLTHRAMFLVGGRHEGDRVHYVAVANPQEFACCTNSGVAEVGIRDAKHTYLVSESPGDVERVDSWTRDGSTDRPDWMKYFTCPRWEQ